MLDQMKWLNSTLKYCSRYQHCEHLWDTKLSFTWIRCDLLTNIRVHLLYHFLIIIGFHHINIVIILQITSIIQPLAWSIGTLLNIRYVADLSNRAFICFPNPYALWYCKALILNFHRITIWEFGAYTFHIVPHTIHTRSSDT